MSKQPYEKEFKDNIARLRLGGGKIESLAKEYRISKNSVLKWTEEYREECQRKAAEKNEGESVELKLREENLKLRQQNAELTKENEFLKKAAAFFARGID